MRTWIEPFVQTFANTKTRKTYANVLNSYFKSVNVDEISPSCIQDFVQNELKKNIRSHVLSHKLSILRRFCLFLEYNHIIDHNPVPKILLPKHPVPAKTYLSLEKLQYIFHEGFPNTPMGWRNQAIFSMLYFGGAKIGEILGITLEDVLLEDQSIRIDTRIVKIEDAGWKCIIDYVQKGRNFFCKPDKETTLVFLSNRGTRLSREQIWRVLKKVDSSLTPEYLRRSFAFHSLQKGMDIQTLQKQLGYSSIDSMNYLIE